MRFEGNLRREGRFWAIEVPVLAVVTQGRTKKEAFEMIADAIAALVNKSDFEVYVYPGNDGYFEVGASSAVDLTALLLKRQRQLNGVSLTEAAARLDATSPNTYARYEQARTMPSVEQLVRLLSAAAPGTDLLIAMSRSRQPA